MLARSAASVCVAGGPATGSPGTRGSVADAARHEALPVPERPWAAARRVRLALPAQAVRPTRAGRVRWRPSASEPICKPGAPAAARPRREQHRFVPPDGQGEAGAVAMIGACLTIAELGRVNILLRALELTDATLNASDRELIERLRLDEDNLREATE